MHRYLGGLSTLNSISIWLEKACGKIPLKREMYLFEVCEDTILVFPCDCVTVLPSIERSTVSHFC